MPVLKLPGVKLRGFRDMTADDVKQALSDARPDLKLSDLDPRQMDLPKIDLSGIDLPGAASAAAAAAAERNPLRRRRSRRPMFIAGLVVAVLGLLAIANAGWIRARLAELGERARTRMDADQVNESLEPIDGEDAYTGTIGIPVQPGAFADTLPSAEGTPVGAGYGSSHDGGFDTGSQGETREEGEFRGS